MISPDDVDHAERSLREGGITTDQQFRWAAAVGAVQVLIRRSDGDVWESWHSQPWGLDDGEMMRANAAMTRLVHQHVDLAGTDWPAVGAALTDPDRRLPDGRTLAEYAGRRRLPALHRDVAGNAADLQRRQDALGPRVSLLRLASLTALWGDRWYGMPVWPRIVEEFCAAADDPAHPHWHGTPPPPRPAAITDAARLRDLLLAGPDHLDAESAAWCITAHLPYLLLPADR
ncbi:hypothetical protein [Modestobacter roseus]|uniref:hypothetical protein n=1 Tax=Modestobacter roseus TaxID=1181884 RepID=UPI001295F4F1|nr:hypothetical protein [Modestobacter roseus]MQA35282.1 hypothetical protein [Modestobacter roseus]